MTREKPPVFNVDCYGIDFDTYQFLLGDIAQAIEDGNRMYGFGEPGYIGADGNFHPFTADNDNKPKISRAKTRTRKPSTEVAIARGIIKIHSPMEVRKEVNH